jgi:thiol-disulfide isomerase/thioredoxin
MLMASVHMRQFPTSQGDVPTLYLFVAAWCAPCRIELRHLTDIADAARPARIRVIAADGSPATRKMLADIDPVLVWHPKDDAERDLVRRLRSGMAGLPYAVVTDIDRRPCADSQSGLTPDNARKLLRQCRPTAD